MKKIIISSLFIVLYFFPVNLNAEIKTISEGSIDAKIKLIIFESLTCSHCAHFHKKIYPGLKENFIDKGHVYIEFKNFPLDMAAMNASKIAHCRNDGNSEILHFLFDNQNEWVKGNTIADINVNLNKFAKENMTFYNLKLDECMTNKKVEDHILEDRIEGATKYKLKATPTLIINGEKFDNPTNFKKLKKFLEKLI
tara:strand:+ start:66 stop:653 length:588 start_codon:yes stop_codon:yes gene_type:complete